MFSVHPVAMSLSWFHPHWNIGSSCDALAHRKKPCNCEKADIIYITIHIVHLGHVCENIFLFQKSHINTVRRLIQLVGNTIIWIINLRIGLIRIVTVKAESLHAQCVYNSWIMKHDYFSDMKETSNGKILN